MNSHPCKHPKTARRASPDDNTTHDCVKCGKKFDTASGEEIKVSNIIPFPSAKRVRRWSKKNRQHRHGHFNGTENGPNSYPR